MPSQFTPEQELQRKSFPGQIVTEHDCLHHAKNLKGRVVVVTGAGSGFGESFCLLAASQGAKVVASDVSLASVQATADQVKAAGGQAVATRCDVTNWESQVAMFKLGVKTFGQIDVVVPNAGVTEALGWFEDNEVKGGGEPAKPNMMTFNVNLLGAMYTTKLAYYYLRQKPNSGPKSIVLLGSMSSHFGIPLAPMYTMSKHAMLGLMRSIYFSAKTEGININIVCPWFVETGIITTSTRLAIAGLPLGTVSDVVLAIARAASDPDCQGEILSVDPDGILSIPQECFGAGDTGYYTAFEKRAAGSIAATKFIRDLITTFRAPLRIILKLLALRYIVNGLRARQPKLLGQVFAIRGVEGVSDVLKSVLSERAVWGRVAAAVGVLVAV